MKITFSVRPIYLPLWQQDKRYFILMGGRGAGRSTAASQYVVSRLPDKQYMRCALMRAISSDIRHSSWKEINDRIDEQNVRSSLKITDNDMHIEYGQNSVQAHGFRASSGSHSAKLKSLASYNVVHIEEAEEIGEQEFRTLDDTLRTVRGNIRIILSLNPPPKSHWIIQKWFDLEESGVSGFYIPKLKQLDDAFYITGTYKDNLVNLNLHTVQRYESYKELKPAYYWQMIRGLVPEVVRGKIYSGWQKIDSIPEDARLVRFGEDYGWFPDPAAVVAIYYYNGGYIFDEVAYGTELSNEFLANKIFEVDDSGETLTVADSAEPKSIEEQKTKGLNIIGSEKGKDSVGYGIKVVSEKKIYVTKRSVNIWREYENYAWLEDKDGNPTGEPNHNYSHSMDAIRYGLTSLVRPEISEGSVHIPDDVD